MDKIILEGQSFCLDGESCFLNGFIRRALYLLNMFKLNCIYLPSTSHLQRAIDISCHGTFKEQNNQYHTPLVTGCYL